MGSEAPGRFGQDIVDAKYGSGPARMGPTGGQVTFDILFGVLAPIALLLADPALFVADVADRAALPPYWAMPTYVAQGTLVAGLVVWGLAGMRRPVLGMLLAGPFAAGALLSLALGLALLWFALGHADLLSGWLAFTPWFTAFVFARHCVLACRAGAQRSVPATVIALVGTCVGIVVALTTIGAARDYRARQLESLLLSDDPDDLALACAQIHHPDVVDMDRIALAYWQMKEGDPRRGRLKDAHLRLTDTPIEGAVDRLRRSYGAFDQDAARAPKEKENLIPTQIDHLFSKDHDEHLRAASELVTPNPDPKMLDAIVRRYSELTETDPRRRWVAAAYTSLNSEGETIQAAVKRLKPRPAPDRKGPRPPSKAPGTDRPEPPRLPAPGAPHAAP